MTIEAVLVRLDRSSDQGCWIWYGGLDKDGYGKVKIGGKDKRVHRAVYEHFHGTIPSSLHLHHKLETCSSRACANPDHLEPVSPSVHPLLGDTLPARNLAKTHCPKGHSLTEGNLVYHSNSTHRNCLTCVKEARKTDKAKAYQREWRRKYRATPRGKAARKAEFDRKKQRKEIAKTQNEPSQ